GCFISKTDMKGIAINVAVKRDSTNAHLLAGPDNTAGNLAAVGDQYFLKLSKFRYHLLSKVQSPRSKALSSSIGLGPRTLDFGRLLLNAVERLTILNGLSILNVNLGNFSGSFGLDFIHQLHCLDNTDHRIGLDTAPDFHKSLGVGRGGAIKGADDWRGD